MQARGLAWQTVYVAAQRAGCHRVEGASGDPAGDGGAQLLLQPLLDLVASLQESGDKISRGASVVMLTVHTPDRYSSPSFLIRARHFVF